jgi:hypothetical protein
MGSRDDTQRELRDAEEQIDRLDGRSYRSPDEALAALLMAQTKLNYALSKSATASSGGYALLQADIPDTLERVIAKFIDRARGLAKQFKAVQVSVQVGGFPPSVSLSLAWATG